MAAPADAMDALNLEESVEDEQIPQSNGTNAATEVLDSKKKKKKKKKATTTMALEVTGQDANGNSVGSNVTSAQNGKEEEDDGEHDLEVADASDAAKKKKKNRSRKKKSTLEQSDPPSIPVMDLFPTGEFPEGEIQQYKDE